MKRVRVRGRPLSGAILAIVAILLPVLLGMVGLVIDGGLLMAAHRQARNAADAGALAAAMDLLAGRASSVAGHTATTYVQQYNGMQNSQVTVNIPPASGPHKGSWDYAEVIVSRPSPTIFIQVLGLNADPVVVGRSVAGYRPIQSPVRVLALNPAARPGLDVGGGGSVLVNGPVATNSEGGGVDQFGQSVANGNTGTAASVSNNATFRATSIRTVGGVNNPANFQHWDTMLSGTPLRAKSGPQPDPFMYLPPPTTATGADPTDRGSVNITGNVTATLLPGVYSSLAINSGTITIAPGIYIIRGGDLKITEQDVVADGVMFYLTGSDYDVHTGYPDVTDYEAKPPASGNASFGSATINAGLHFTAYDDPSSPFHGMLFYQRRLNTREFSIQGNSAAGDLKGTIYAKWASLKISGQGTYNAQFVTGSLTTSGNGTVTILDGGGLIGRSNQVFLVE
jgi:Flp pilus assembly protein TadG